MAAKRWKEESAIERSEGTPNTLIRARVGTTFKHIIDELCDSQFHKANGYLDWEQLFNSEDRFTKWIDRYENGFSQRKAIH